MNTRTTKSREVRDRLGKATYTVVTLCALALFGLTFIPDMPRQLESLLVEVSAGLLAAAVVFFIVDRVFLWRPLEALEEEVEELRHDVRLLIEEDIVHASKRALEGLDRNMYEIFGKDIEGTIVNLRSAIKNKKFILHDPRDTFRLYYVETLRTFPKSTFYATSLATPAYFWLNKDSIVSVEDGIKAFLEGGGTTHRIFFIDSDEEISSPNIKEILDNQVNMGVKVYVAKYVGDDMDRLFVVNEEKTIGWETKTNNRGHINNVYAIADEKELSALYDIWTKLRNLHTTTPYTSAMPAEQTAEKTSPSPSQTPA